MSESKASAQHEQSGSNSTTLGQARNENTDQLVIMNSQTASAMQNSPKGSNSKTLKKARNENTDQFAVAINGQTASAIQNPPKGSKTTTLERSTNKTAQPVPASGTSASAQRVQQRSTSEDVTNEITPRESLNTPIVIQVTKITDVIQIGRGFFGEVYRGRLDDSSNRLVAIKKVLKYSSLGGMELEILRRFKHQNVVNLLSYYYTLEQGSSRILHLVLEYVPMSLTKVIRSYRSSIEMIPVVYVKLYAYQIFRGLHYLHSNNICHRDIHTGNLLVDPDTGVLKLCDFGLSAEIQSGGKYESYVVNRVYRAPELFLAAGSRTQYTCQIDVWSAGCVLAHMLLLIFLFPLPNVLAEITRVLGTPTRQQIRDMGLDPSSVKVTKRLRGVLWSEVMGSNTPAEAVDLMSRLMVYSPSVRLKPSAASAHAFFDDLRDPNTRLPSGRHLPQLDGMQPQSDVTSSTVRHPHTSTGSTTLHAHAVKGPMTRSRKRRLCAAQGDGGGDCNG